MNIKINTINPKFLFAFILVLQTMLMVVKGYEKEFFHMDEASTFILSNSKYGIQTPNEYKNRWRASTDYYNLLVATTDTKFDYKQTYINQTQDVHPPLYYFIIHTISSLFPYQFSKWFGIIPNIIFFLCTQVFIFLTANSIFNSKYKAILPCIIYGFSLGAIHTVEYIRMYAMLTSILTIAIYTNIQALNTKSNKYFFLLIIINTTGILTHYYYIVSYFFMCICTVGLFYIQSQYNYIKKYILSNIATLFLALICYPAIFLHIFSGYRGVEAFQNFTSTSFWDRLYLFYKVVNKHMFFSSFYVIFLLLTFYIIYHIIIKKNIKYSQRLIMTIPRFTFPVNFHLPPQLYSISLITFTAICSLMIIAKVSPYTDFRYIAALYPLFAIITSYLLLKIAQKNIFLKILALTFPLLIIIFGIKSDYSSQYKGYNNFLSADSSIENCIIVDTSGYDFFSIFFQIATRYKKTYIITQKNINTLPYTAINLLQTQKDNQLDVFILNTHPEKFNNIESSLINSVPDQYKTSQQTIGYTVGYISRIKIKLKEIPE